MARALKEELFNRFKEDGNLFNLTLVLQKMPQFMLNLRDESATVYYKCLRLIEINLDGTFDVTPEYLVPDLVKRDKTKNQTKEQAKEQIKQLSQQLDKIKNQFLSDHDFTNFSEQQWMDFLMSMACKIDIWRFNNSEKTEKEIQQRMVMENNYFGDADATDYFIIDTEYAEKGESGRFDAIALHWSRNMRKKKDYRPGLAFIEVKVGQDAIKGSSGICKHLSDVNDFKVDDKFRQDIEKMVAQLKELKLIDIPGNTDLKIDSDKTSQMIFVLANYNQNSSILNTEICKLTSPNTNDLDLRFAVSCFMGYGLFDEGMLTLQEFKQKYSL